MHIWTNAGILLIRPSPSLRNNHQWNVRNLRIFIQENTSENIVWKMVSIPIKIRWSYILNRKPYTGNTVCLNWDGSSNLFSIYRKTSNISRTLVGNKIVDNPDVHSQLNTCLQWVEWRQLYEDTRNIWVLGFVATYTRSFTVCFEQAPGSLDKALRMYRVDALDETLLSYT